MLISDGWQSPIPVWPTLTDGQCRRDSHEKLKALTEIYFISRPPRTPGVRQSSCTVGKTCVTCYHTRQLAVVRRNAPMSRGSISENRSGRRLTRGRLQGQATIASDQATDAAGLFPAQRPEHAAHAQTAASNAQGGCRLLFSLRFRRAANQNQGNFCFNFSFARDATSSYMVRPCPSQVHLEQGRRTDCRLAVLLA